jgi:hypothetical protein
MIRTHVCTHTHTHTHTHTTLWEWFALPNAARSHKCRFFSPYCSYYVPNSVAAGLHCTSQTELCTAYVMIVHVALLTHTDIYSSLLQVLKTHMAVRVLQFLVSNGKAAHVSGQMFQHPKFLPPLLSGWYRKWYWMSHAQRFRTHVWYSTKKIKNSSAYYAYIKTIKFECTDKPHSVEHFQTVPHIMWIPSIWILDSLPWGLLTFEGFEGTKT